MTGICNVVRLLIQKTILRQVPQTLLMTEEENVTFDLCQLWLWEDPLIHSILSSIPDFSVLDFAVNWAESSLMLK